MKKLLFSFGLVLFYCTNVFSQEQIAVIQNPYVVLMNAETGVIEDPQFIDLSLVDAGTPKGIIQVGSEIWVSDQIEDAIFRFDMSGTHLSTITGNMDNVKGLALINDSEVWVTNAGSGNGAPGDAIVRFDTSGNYLGFYPTHGNSTFDVVDAGNGEVFISYIDGGSPIERWDYSGNYIDNVVNPNTLNFAQQLWLMDSGNLLVGNFSSPSGVYIFDPATGTQVDYWSESSVRGVIETGDGNILWTSGSGIFKLDVATGNSTLVAAGGAQFFTLLNPDDSDCTTPTLTVEDAEICEGSSATLTATSNGDEVNWYDSATGTTPIYTGTTFETPALTATTSYWVQAVSYGTGGDGEIIEGGARVAPASNSNSSVVAATSPWGLSFDTTADFTITSVDVYLASNNPGDLVMQLLDENWAVLEETTVACPAGSSSNPVQFEVPLNFSVEAGNTYRLVAASSPVMVREFSSEHAGFPYPIGDVGSVIGGTINNSETNNTLYYFFYNWTVQTGDITVCESDMTEVVVTVNPAPDAPLAVGDFYFEDGDTLADLEDSLDFTGDLTWYADEDLTTVLPDTTLIVDGTTYWVTQTVNGCESEATAVLVEELSISDFNNNAFAYYPNPVKDVLNITGKNQIDSLEIFDLTGRKLMNISEVQNGQVDFRSFEQGTYLVKITSGTDVQVIKVIKK
ncbi:T9SS type A sorting domain-containing protein [Moheibacter sp.]|uniref:Ig-like domain-containing protein n=1 Tax=Moheibacter sp. TaxID=1965316 RepID=UPI003C749184